MICLFLQISYTSSTQPSEEDNKEQIPDLLKPPSQQSSTLHRNMTDLDLYLQELADTSEILNRADTKNLSTFFPPRGEYIVCQLFNINVCI